MRDRNYLDGEIKKNRMTSYGHALRYYIYSDKVQKRELSKLRAENARLKGIQEVLERGPMEQITQQENLGHTYTAKKD